MFRKKIRDKNTKKNVHKAATQSKRITDPLLGRDQQVEEHCLGDFLQIFSALVTLTMR